MALKYELDSIEGMDESTVAMYEKDEESGKYRLAIDGLPQQEDVSGLKTEVEQLLGEKKAAAQAAKDAESAAEAAKLEAAKKSGDVEALERSWTEKLSNREKELSSELEQYKNTINGLTSGSTAKSIASELAAVVNGVSMAPHLERDLQGRLRTEYREGKPVTVVLDRDGKPSAMSIDELKTEYSTNPQFAPLIVGSKATGAGPAGGKGPGAEGTNVKAEEAKSRGDLTGFLKASIN